MESLVTSGALGGVQGHTPGRGKSRQVCQPLLGWSQWRSSVSGWPGHQASKLQQPGGAPGPGARGSEEASSPRCARCA